MSDFSSFRPIKRSYIPLFIFTLFFFVIQCFVIPYEGDDTYFLAAVQDNSNLFTFIRMRYLTWSGRITSEFLIGLFSLGDLWIWKLMNTVVMTLFIFELSQIIQLVFWGTQSEKEEQSIFFINCFVCLAFFMIPISVTTRACSWFTGSFFYLWPTLALLFILKIFIKYFLEASLTKKDYILCALAALYTGSMEQTVAVAFCFSIIILTYIYLKKHLLDIKLLPSVLINLAYLIFCSLCPGNQIRLTSETSTWYPDFDTLSLIDKMLQGINWTHTHILKEYSVAMLVLSLMLFILVLPKIKLLLLKVVCFLPSLYFIGMLFPFNRLAARTTSFEYNYDIESITNKLFFDPMSGILPSVIALCIILLLGVLLYHSLASAQDRYLCILMYLAALASGYILGLSPTIFASGPRIFFLADILLLMISGIVLGELIKTVKMNSLFWRLSVIVYSSFSSIMAIMYLGGIAIKSIFKIN